MIAAEKSLLAVDVGGIDGGTAAVATSTAG